MSRWTEAIGRKGVGRTRPIAGIRRMEHHPADCFLIMDDKDK
jgi:hypothetical protein